MAKSSLQSLVSHAFLSPLAQTGHFMSGIHFGNEFYIGKGGLAKTYKT